MRLALIVTLTDSFFCKNINTPCRYLQSRQLLSKPNPMLTLVEMKLGISKRMALSEKRRTRPFDLVLVNGILSIWRRLGEFLVAYVRRAYYRDDKPINHYDK